MMRIEQTTPEAEIRRAMEKAYNAVMQESLKRLLYIGEAALNAAREKGSYTDQTGNLRSSVGYVVVYDGKIVQTSGFKRVKDGAACTGSGQAYAERVSRGLSSKGLILVVVAGMKYATYVAKTKDVLDSAELVAENLTARLL